MSSSCFDPSSRLSLYWGWFTKPRLICTRPRDLALPACLSSSQRPLAILHYKAIPAVPFSLDKSSCFPNLFFPFIFPLSLLFRSEIKCHFSLKTLLTLSFHEVTLGFSHKHVLVWLIGLTIMKYFIHLFLFVFSCLNVRSKLAENLRIVFTAVSPQHRAIGL